MSEISPKGKREPVDPARVTKTKVKSKREKVIGMVSHCVGHFYFADDL